MLVAAVFAAATAGCAAGPRAGGEVPTMPETFDSSLGMLSVHTSAVILQDPAGQSRVAVAPEFAGRVMFSTYGGESGPALGWMNREVVAGKRDPAFVNFGGAERIWLSPEGGQYSTFFRPGAAFEFKNWRVPSCFNDEAFKVVSSSMDSVTLRKDLKVRNYLGNALSLKLDRKVGLVKPEDLEKLAGCALPEGVRFVGYRSDNALTNVGPEVMTSDTGLVSLWVLCMFVPSKNTLAIVPVKADASGPIVIDDYFGKIPPARLTYSKTQSCVIFKVDGKERGKIGLPAERARDVVASMDFDQGILTIVKFSLPDKGRYLRNTWEKHKNPFGGDVVNSYNDGPPGPGLPPLGGFYELENLSPARELKPGAKLEHWSAVLHFHGPIEKLNEVSTTALGVDLTKLPRL